MVLFWSHSLLQKLDDDNKPSQFNNCLNETGKKPLLFVGRDDDVDEYAPRTSVADWGHVCILEKAQ